MYLNLLSRMAPEQLLLLTMVLQTKCFCKIKVKPSQVIYCNYDPFMYSTYSFISRKTVFTMPTRIMTVTDDNNYYTSFLIFCLHINSNVALFSPLPDTINLYLVLSHHLVGHGTTKHELIFCNLKGKMRGTGS